MKNTGSHGTWCPRRVRFDRGSGWGENSYTALLLVVVFHTFGGAFFTYFLQVDEFCLVSFCFCFDFELIYPLWLHTVPLERSVLVMGLPFMAPLPGDCSLCAMPAAQEDDSRKLRIVKSPAS